MTAISRKTLPVPTRWLFERNEIKGTILDYGCGRCHEINNKFFTADGYDPYYRPNGLPFCVGGNKKLYDTILCIYVLCTIPTHKEQLKILHHIQSLLTDNGRAYIAVRNDRPKQGWGWTSRKTYQGRAGILKDEFLLYQGRQFRIYLLTPYDKLV